MTTPIRIGIAGLGRAGWNMHCEELMGKEFLFQIVAACDVLKKRRDMAFERYGCSTYRNIGDLIADPNVELVDIATRSPEHFAHATMALRAGKHVFLEKPICLDYRDAQRLMAEARRSKGNLYVRHNRRFEPGFLHVREIMASGILGEVFQIKLARTGYQRRDDWQSLRRCGGGQLVNWGPHIIDHALRLLESPVESVWGDLKCTATVGDAEDHVKLVLRGTNGRIVDVEISGGAAIGLPEYVIWGTKGALTASDREITLKYLDPKHKLPRRRPRSGDPNLGWGKPDDLRWVEKKIPVKPAKIPDIWEELYRAIRSGKAFPITLKEALEVMRVVSEVKRQARAAAEE